MTYVCIKCKKIWLNGNATCDYSGGLCEECTVAYLRGRQKKQGFHDCFKRATQVCSRGECNYWQLCNRQLAV
jgi:hypothetical protein